MLSKNKLLLASTILISCFTWANAAQFSETQLANLFAGKDVFFDMREKNDSNGWDSAHFRFLENGDMMGYLFSSDFLSAKSPSNDVDNGIWEIKENKVCIHWSQWNESIENCYAIYKNDQVYVAKSDSDGLFTGEFDPQY